MNHIQTIDFIGNLQSKKLCKEWSQKFIGRTINLVPEDEPLDDEDEDEDQEDDDDVDQDAINELSEMME